MLFYFILFLFPASGQGKNFINTSTARILNPWSAEAESGPNCFAIRFWVTSWFKPQEHWARYEFAAQLLASDQLWALAQGAQGHKSQAKDYIARAVLTACCGTISNSSTTKSLDLLPFIMPRAQWAWSNVCNWPRSLYACGQKRT